jgi:hypothetical protein
MKLPARIELAAFRLRSERIYHCATGASVHQYMEDYKPLIIPTRNISFNSQQVGLEVLSTSCGSEEMNSFDISLTLSLRTCQTMTIY